MANPVTKIRNTAADYRKLDGRDKRRFWTDGILNNALYILMAIFIIYTAIVNHNFLKIGSITNIISLAAASLPFALGVAGCIVLTGTDLSGGQWQKLAIARAHYRDRNFVLLDEPTGNLDTQNSSEVIALLKEASRKYEQTIILITHSRSIAQTADRILQVSDGVLTDFGRCRE